MSRYTGIASQTFMASTTARQVKAQTPTLSPGFTSRALSNMNNACLPREKARAAGASANRENDSSYSCLRFLVNRYDFFDLWDFFFEQALDSHFEGHFCAGASGAGALKADLDC